MRVCVAIKRLSTFDTNVPEPSPFEGESQATWFEGNYQEYEADRRRRLGDEADQPHRIRYKKLVA